MSDPLRPAVPESLELQAEAITLLVRWVGLVIGYLLVNLGAAPDAHVVGRGPLNLVLAFGAAFAVVDTLWSLRGRVLLGAVPLLVSLLEAVFIGLLCYFERGLESPFRFYYFLSLLISAVRHRPRVTYATFALHALSYLLLAQLHGTKDSAAVEAGVSTLALMMWATWASTSLAGLLRKAEARTAELNQELKENQWLLEERIATRTRELEESQAMLVQQEKQAAFGLLAAGIAHEVGNPLAAISSLAQMLARREASSSESDSYTAEKLRLVDEQVGRVQRTLRELTDFSRPASGEISRVSLKDVCGSALSIAKYYKRRKGKEIVESYAELSALFTVRDQLVQVVLNLILNAMDATEEGGRIQVSTCREDEDREGGNSAGWHVIRIEDDGHGIPAYRHSEVFRPYVTTKEDGTGLGLFVCRNLVQQSLGGELQLEHSEPGRTVFVVRVPAADASAESSATASSSRGDG